MKKLFLLAFAAATLASCSDDDGINTNNDSALKKIETFGGPIDSTPWGVINTKQVQAYQNGVVVSDTTYNAANNQVFRYTVRATSVTQYTETCYNANGTVFYEFIKNYDSTGRIIETKYTLNNTEEDHKYIAYTANTATLTAIDPYNGQIYTAATFGFNAEGYISDMHIEQQHWALTYENGKLTHSLLTSAGTTDPITYNYYNNAIPSQYIATPLQTNNAILSTTTVQSAAFEIYDFKGTDDGEVYQIQFNSQGYITSRIELLYGTNTESFYYYNE